MKISDGRNTICKFGELLEGDTFEFVTAEEYGKIFLKIKPINGDIVRNVVNLQENVCTRVNDETLVRKVNSILKIED